MNRRLIAALLAGCAAALLPSGAFAKVKLTYTYWGAQSEDAIQKRLVAAFNAQNPDVEVEASYNPSGYEGKIQAEIAAGTGPDIMFFQDEPFPSWVRNGVFEDLSPYFATDKSIQMDDFLPQTKEYFQYHGRQWSLPAEGGPITWFYNKTFFDQAGLELPDYDWTLADWRTDVKKLTRDGNGDGKIDVYGVTMPGGWTYNEPWIWTFGAKYIDVGLPDREIAYVHTNTAAFKNALQFLHDIRFVDGVSGGSFNNGTSAMMITGPWGISDSAPKMKAAGYEFDFAPMPIGPLGGRATRQSFDTWVIWSGSPHKKEAYRFVSYALSPAGECLFADRAMPARFSALKCFVHDRTPYHEEVFGRIMSSGEGWMQPTNVQYSDVGSVLNKYINDVLANRMAPQEAAEHMYVEGNAILSKLWPPEWQAEWKDSQSIPQAEADRIFAQDRQIRSFKH